MITSGIGATWSEAAGDASQEPSVAPGAAGLEGSVTVEDSSQSQNDNTKTQVANSDVAASARSDVRIASGSSLTVNTNLEQISDWLTKIIVGVSLVESKPLLERMERAAIYMADSMSANAAASAATHSFACALIVYFLATGLLGSYLLTRLFLQPALQNAVNLQDRR